MDPRRSRPAQDQKRPGDREDDEAEVEEAIRPYFPDDRMSLPAQAIMVTARK